MRLKIITIAKNQKKLRQISKPLPIADITEKRWQKFFQALGQKMLAADGAGLAAPQVSISVRVIAVNENNQAKIMINPVITEKSTLREKGEEGCLSVPAVYGLVIRPQKITVEYYDPAGLKITTRESSLAARVIQHEIDHLDGILFIDKLAEK